MPEPGKMTPAQRVEFSLKKKALGNSRYKDKAFPAAIKAYKEALTYIGSASGWGGEEEKKSLRKLKIDCENNLCAAYLASREFDKAKAAALRVFQIDAENVRCLERLAKIYLATNYLAKAENMIHRLKNLPEAKGGGRVEVFEKSLESKRELERKRKAAFAEKFKNLSFGYEESSGGDDKEGENVLPPLAGDDDALASSSSFFGSSWTMYLAFGVLVGAVALGAIFTQQQM
uniref:Peptidylprolyl isomerase n=1 Tax=Bigelowiella natans TaxID=227086 RepID=A0A7S2KK14_BIGNA